MSEEWLYHGTGLGAAVQIFASGMLRGFTKVPGGRGVSLSATASVSLDRFANFRSTRHLHGVLELAMRQSQTWQRRGAVLAFPAGELGRLATLTRQDMFDPDYRLYEDEIVAHGHISGEALALAQVHTEPGALEAYAESLRRWATVPDPMSDLLLGERDRRCVLRHADAAAGLALRARPLAELADKAEPRGMRP